MVVPLKGVSILIKKNLLVKIYQNEIINTMHVVLGYPPVGSSCIWVCLLNKCDISNSYCQAMACFGIIQCEQIFFNSDLKCLSVLSNVDRKYYLCIPKKR